MAEVLSELPTTIKGEGEAWKGFSQEEQEAMKSRHRAVGEAKRWGSEVTPEGRLEVGGRSKMVKRAREEMERDLRQQLTEALKDLRGTKFGSQSCEEIARRAREVERLAGWLDASEKSRKARGVEQALPKGGAASKAVSGSAEPAEPAEKERLLEWANKRGGWEEQLGRGLDQLVEGVENVFAKWGSALDKLGGKFKAVGVVMELSVRSLVEAPEFLFKSWRLGKAEERAKRYKEALRSDAQLYKERVEAAREVAMERVKEAEEDFQGRKAELAKEIVDERANFQREFAGRRSLGWQVIKGIRGYLMENQQARRVVELERQKREITGWLTDSFDLFREELLARRNKALEHGNEQLDQALRLQQKWEKSMAGVQGTREGLSRAIDELLA